jgi:organic radical activating enzyme
MKNKLEYYAINHKKYKMFIETLYTTVVLTDKCNNNCYYCNGNFNKHKENYNFLNKEQFSELVKFLSIQKRNHITIVLTGGEPTLHPNFSYFLNEIEKIPNMTNTYVNTSLIKSYKYFQELPLRKSLDFICSYHSHVVKDDEEWFSKVDFLHKKGCLTQVFLMLTDKNIDRIKKVYNKYKDKYSETNDMFIVYPINEFAYTERFKRLVKNGDFDYFSTHADCKGNINFSSDEMKVILSDGTNDYLNYDKYSNFYFMLCCCGIAVHPDGRLTRCIHDTEPVITLGKNKIKKISEWHLCRQKKCICDLEYPKCSIDYYKKHFKKEDVNET